MPGAFLLQLEKYPAATGIASVAQAQGTATGLDQGHRAEVGQRQVNVKRMLAIRFQPAFQAEVLVELIAPPIDSVVGRDRVGSQSKCRDVAGATCRSRLLQAII